MSGGLATDRTVSLIRSEGRHAGINCGELGYAPRAAAKVIMQSALQSAIKALSPQQSPCPAGIDDVAQSGPMFGLANVTGWAPTIRATTSSDARTFRSPLALPIDRAKAESILDETRFNAGSLPATAALSWVRTNAAFLAVRHGLPLEKKRYLTKAASNKISTTSAKTPKSIMPHVIPGPHPIIASTVGSFLYGQAQAALIVPRFL